MFGRITLLALVILALAPPAGAAPTEGDLKTALQAEVDRRTSVYDGMASQCDTFKRDNNPIGAMMCAMSGFGTITGERLGMRITDVQLDFCWTIDAGEYLCHYKVRATGNPGGNPILQLIFQVSQAGTWTDARFGDTPEGLRLLQVYDYCTYGDNGSANCHWTERR